MSSVSKAVAGLDAFAKQVTQFLESSSASNARPWDIDREGFKVIEFGIELEKRLAEVEKHQRAQQQIEAVQQSIADKTSKVALIGQALEESERELEREIERAEALLGKDNKSDQNKAVPIEWVLQLARKLSYTTHAPSGWHYKQNRPLPDRFRPPMPDLDALKGSTLYYTPEQVFERQKKDFKASLTAESAPVKEAAEEAGVEWEDEDQDEKSPEKMSSEESLKQTQSEAENREESYRGGRRNSSRAASKKDEPASAKKEEQLKREESGKKEDHLAKRPRRGSGRE